MTEQEAAVVNTEEQDQEEPDDGIPIVLVTGASGFVATHLIKQLLEQGKYHVRGTVRNKKRQEKVAHWFNYYDHINSMTSYVVSS